jgi:hypothetical protein
MVELSAHELQQDLAELDRTFRTEVRRARDEVMRELPPGIAIDRAHVAELLSQQWTSARPYAMAKHYLIGGLVAAGWSAAEIAPVLNMQPDEVERENERSVYAQPSGAELDALSTAKRAVWDERGSRAPGDGG